MPSSSAEPPIKEFRTPAAWEKWLERHHDDDAGVWMKFAKKGTGVTTVTYAEALEVALCFGWIDAQVKRFDDTYYLQRFTPRRTRSKKAREFFATLSASSRYSILYRIQDAKRPETRARRIAQFVEMLARGEKPS